MLGKIKEVREVFNIDGGRASISGSNGSQLGMASMIQILANGYGCYDGFKVETENHVFYILIENGQSCCESWGSFSSEDNFENYIGAELLEVNLTDVGLNLKKLKEESDYYYGEGGIQFVDFVTSEGVFQFAVYNCHNGYYGHGIYILKDQEVLCEDTL